MATKTQSRRSGRQRKPKKLTKGAIRERVGERSYQRGEAYFDGGAVFDCRRQGTLLKGRCEGQSAASYAVEARVEGGQIEEADCSCPVGDGGFCKHVAALLLTWLDAPDDFRETEPPEVFLARCTKAQLIGLIEQMLEQEPDLESWLEVAVPKAGKKGAAVDSAAYRSRAAAAFHNAGYGWEADGEVTGALETLKQIGDDHLKRREFEAAAAVYGGILEGFVKGYEDFHDETGNVGGVACECIEGLSSCFGELPEAPEARQAALEALFEVLKFDIEFGGIGLSDGVPGILCEQTTPEERSEVAGWIRQLMPRGDASSSQWRRKTLGGILLDLEKPSDDEAHIEHCRKFGLTGDLVDRLLKLGRLEEALAEIKQAPAHSLTLYADLLVSHRRSELAESLVRECLLREKEGNRRWELSEWLERFFASRKRWQDALELALEEFRDHPGLSGYRGIRKYAKRAKKWKSLRPEVMEIVRRGCETTELIRIHLDESEVSEAVELLTSGSSQRKRGAWAWDRVDLEVAQAAEKSHPEAASTIYSAHARQLIAERGRGNYRAACDYLKKVRRLLKRLGRSGDWQNLIGAIREEHPSLRALREELDRARL